MSANGAAVALESPCLTARQAAAYLHLNEKKLYELANSREIPAARVGGKWLFPRALLDDWLLEQAHGGLLRDRLLIGGSDDPLLSGAVHALGADLGGDAFVAFGSNGAQAGLEQLARRRIDVTALHWGDADHSGAQHAMLLQRWPAHTRWTLVRVALREQGVLLRPGLGRDRLETLAAGEVRWAMQRAGSGSRHLVESALRNHGLRSEDCMTVATPTGAREAAAMLVRGEADCAPGCRSTAAEYGLAFLPLGQVAFDLALPKEVFFRHLFQQLLARLNSAELRDLAARLGGYDLAPLGSVVPLKA